MLPNPIALIGPFLANPELREQLVSAMEEFLTEHGVQQMRIYEDTGEETVFTPGLFAAWVLTNVRLEYFPETFDYHDDGTPAI